MADRGLRRPELLDGLEVQLAQPPLGGIVIGGAGHPVLVNHRGCVDLLPMDCAGCVVSSVMFVYVA